MDNCFAVIILYLAIFNNANADVCQNCEGGDRDPVVIPTQTKPTPTKGTSHPLERLIRDYFKKNPFKVHDTSFSIRDGRIRYKANLYQNRITKISTPSVTFKILNRSVAKIDISNIDYYLNGQMKISWRQNTRTAKQKAHANDTDITLHYWMMHKRILRCAVDFKQKFVIDSIVGDNLPSVVKTKKFLSKMGEKLKYRSRKTFCGELKMLIEKPPITKEPQNLPLAAPRASASSQK